MATVVVKTGIKKEKGYLYFIDKQGNVAKAKMSRCGPKKGCKNKPNKNVSQFMDGVSKKKRKSTKKATTKSTKKLVLKSVATSKATGKVKKGYFKRLGKYYKSLK